MLRRQRTILKLLSTANAPLSATQIQKYMFLLREETQCSHDSTFYEFLPYKFGPFSFAAQREIEILAAYGYIESDARSMCATALGKEEAIKVDKDTSHAVIAILTSYGKLPVRSLLKDVYTRYPWFALNSELKDLIPAGIDKPQAAAPAVYTIGYESRSVDGFLNNLVRTGIRRIIDVRANPISRKYGFARSALTRLSGKLGLGYSHFPELGIPSKKRKEARTRAEFMQLFSHYEQQTLPAKTFEMAGVAELMQSTPSVLLCMEKKAEDCHRSRLADRIVSLTNLSQVHL
jgi:uncharacterized protein (DUF488 family)